jgi:Tol biopolymer transport system component
VLAELTPDGKQMVFTSFDPVRGRGDKLTSFEVGPSTYNGTGADTSSNAFVWDLSPDGTRIALLKRRENQVHILATSGRTVREVTVKGWNSVAGLNWTADGKGFFVSSKREDSSVLLHVDLQGNAHIVWEQRGWEGLRCVPSPDGRHLAILAFRLNNNVWMMENF